LAVLKLVRPGGIAVHTELDTFLVAPYAELDDGIVPSRKPDSGPGHPSEVTDAELVRLAVAQSLPRFDDELHWQRPAPALVGQHPFPRPRPLPLSLSLSHSAYNQRLRDAGDPMEADLRRVVARTPSTADVVGIRDGTPVRCGASRQTAKRSGPAGWMVFALDKPGLGPGTTGVCGKGFAGADFEADFETDRAALGITVIRPARKDETDQGICPTWPRQRIESGNRTLKGRLGLDSTAPA
jgi:hypothetical protein